MNCKSFLYLTATFFVMLSATTGSREDLRVPTLPTPDRPPPITDARVPLRPRHSNVREVYGPLPSIPTPTPAQPQRPPSPPNDVQEVPVVHPPFSS
ncbi:splicing factor 3A subunit 2-like [Adelges cooleyi]|uniref:splicing factor 3A subunit 2-like n=1 Tax=Adelges cooleyi TaxID=133065 RepID=UPI0021807B50|nr:splicing factor 3A subunit 2-like [Adelges cooleyi]